MSHEGWHTAYIGVGSNMGDKLSNCKRGIADLIREGRSVLINQSKFYMTEPVDYEDQDWFINAVIEIETVCDPFELFKELKHIEQNAGRKQNTIRFGPRVLDMDIIFYNNLIIHTSNLIIPHHRMHTRRFVLQPMCDLNPKMVHPILTQDMQTLLNSLKNEEQRIVQYI